MVFDPATAGGFETAVVLTDNSLGPAGASTQPVPVTGTGIASLTPTTTALTAMPNPAIAGQTVTLTATITPTPTGGTLGSVDFCFGGVGPGGCEKFAARSEPRRYWTMDEERGRTGGGPSCGGGTLLGTVDVIAGGTATYTTTSLAGSKRHHRDL